MWHRDYRNFRETTVFLLIGLELFLKKRWRFSHSLLDFSFNTHCLWKQSKQRRKEPLPETFSIISPLDGSIFYFINFSLPQNSTCFKKHLAFNLLVISLHFIMIANVLFYKYFNYNSILCSIKMLFSLFTAVTWKRWCTWSTPISTTKSSWRKGRTEAMMRNWLLITAESAC